MIKFFQVRSYLTSHKEWNKLRRHPAPMELIWLKIIKEKRSTKTVSQLYKCLQSQISGNTLDTKEKWELEMNSIIEDETWEYVCEEGHRVTNSPLWKEFNWKLKMRYFRTPLLVAKFDKAKQIYAGGIVKTLETTYTFFGTAQT